jgi:hypothetical protein
MSSVARAEELAPLFTWRSAITESGLKPVTRHVALTLSLHMNERGGSCWPSLATLAAETGLAVKTVREHMAALARTGWLERIDRPGSSCMWRARTPAPLPPDTPPVGGDPCPPTGGVAPTTPPVPREDPPPVPREDPPPVSREPSTSLNSSVSPPLAPTSSTRPPPSSKRPAPPKPRKPDLVWEAMLEVCGIDPADLTGTARGAANKAAAELRGVNATPAQVKLRARAWAQRFDGATLTPNALARHWAQLAPNAAPGPGPPNATITSAERDRRRARGEACPRCHDRGTYELEDGTAVQCDHTRPEEASA